MDLQTWTYIIVGVTFALYIGIAIWSAPDQLKNFMLQEGDFSIGKRNGHGGRLDAPHLSYRWPESFPLMAMMVLFI
jgi:hypothetical protein